jgi:hypothetical protein
VICTELGLPAGAAMTFALVLHEDTCRSQFLAQHVHQPSTKSNR